MNQTKKVLARKWNWKVFLLSQIAVILCSAVVSVVTIFLISSIEAELQKASATTVVGIVLSNVLLFETLYVALFIFDPEKLTKTSQFILVSLVITITFVLSSVVYRYCSPFAMPIQLCAILLCILVGMKTGTISVFNLVFIILVNLVLRGACLRSDIITITAAVVGNLLSGIAMIYLASKHFTRIKFLLYCLLAGLS